MAAQGLRAVVKRGHRLAHRLVWARRFGTFGEGTVLARTHKSSGLHHVHLGRDVDLGPFWRIEALEHHHGLDYTPRVTIGDNVGAEIGLHVACAREVVIGRDVLIASWVFISDHSHGIDGALPPKEAPLDEPKPVRIGDGCWLGERAVILPGVELGERCVVGAGAVVTTSFPAGSVVAGVPARLLRTIDAEPPGAR